MTSDASRAFGSCVIQTDSHPSFSATLTLATESSRVFTASMETARRATSSAIYAGDGVRVGNPRRIFGAHAAHLRRCVLRSSLTQQRLRSLRCSAAPSSWTTWSPNLSPRTPPVAVVDERRLREVALTPEEYRAIVEELKRTLNEAELGMLGVL